MMYPTKYNLPTLLELHEQGWLKMSRYKDQLYIFCYSPKTQFEQNWTPLTLAMRGMILGKEGEVIGQCLPKFFNLDEIEESKQVNLPQNSGYEIFQKLDGSYISSFWNPYEMRWQHASKFSFDNEYIDAAYNFLPDIRFRAMDFHSPIDIKNFCLASEIRFNEDPMRRVTGCEPGIYPITCWRKNTDSVEEMPFYTTKLFADKLELSPVHKYSLEEATLEGKLASFRGEEDTEGYVVKYDNGFRVKLKTLWYFQLNKALENFENPLKARESAKAYLDTWEGSLEWLSHLPDEMYEEAKGWARVVINDYNDKVKEVDNLFIDNYSMDRKTFALRVKELPEAPFLFAKYTGKDYKQMIWEKI